MISSRELIEQARTPLSTTVIQGIVRARLNELGWHPAIYSLDASPSTLNAVSADGTMRTVRLGSAMSKRALRELLERLEGGGKRARGQTSPEATKTQADRLCYSDRLGGLA